MEYITRINMLCGVIRRNINFVNSSYEFLS